MTGGENEEGWEVIREARGFGDQTWPINLISSREKLAVSDSGKRSKSNLVSLKREETKLIQHLFGVPDSLGPRAVVFCGIEHGNGCSWICARVAENLAARGPQSVCLVDANHISPSLHSEFGVENLKGLAEAILEGGAIRQYARRVSASNLWLLTSGFHAGDRSIWSSQHLTSVMARLRAEFDYVILDAPAVNLYLDVHALGREADGVVLVVEANSTRRETAQKCKDALEQANIKLLGAVLNKRSFPIPEPIYRML